jgi:hypothetical protein
MTRRESMGSAQYGGYSKIWVLLLIQHTLPVAHIILNILQAQGHSATSKV